MIKTVVGVVRGRGLGVCDASRLQRSVILSLLALLWVCGPSAAQSPERTTDAVEWTAYAGDQRGRRYSPVDNLTPQNVHQLTRAWAWQHNEKARTQPVDARPGMFESTPIMIDDVLYFTTPYNRVIALDAETGRERWTYDPRAYEIPTPALSIGFVHRGVTPWRDGGALRLFYASRHRLICLDAKTGKPVTSFGRDGEVDLSQGLLRSINREHYEHNSPPLVVGDLVIVGSSIGDRVMYSGDPPGQVRAFDARTGRQVWNFNLIPQAGEYGNETWKEGSWRFTGHTNAWASMSADESRGLIYVPVSTPSNDWYGGRRPGDNLFAESLVCLEAATGRRRWHFQVAHHGLWDYDLPAAPVLATITVDGRPLDVVAQVTKNGLTFVFNRETGAPVWPIVERPVPQSDVPREQTSLTQPFPTKPPPFVPQGVSLEDAFDLTPELKSEAQTQMRRFRLGPLYTPPSLEGTLTRPSALGGANWGGAALDPNTNVLYVKGSNSPMVMMLKRFERATSTNPWADQVDVEYTTASYDKAGAPAPAFQGGLPLTKPPYGLLTAINLNTGNILWQVPAGAGPPSVRNHPALRNVTLPDRLGTPHPAGVIVTKGGLVIGGGGDPALYAYDARTGREVWAGPLRRPVGGTPMTFRTRAGTQMVVVPTGSGEDAEMVAFVLASGVGQKP
jgi:quinoprotein glucose dehydrogenase